jgi:hypothetical protein
MNKPKARLTKARVDKAVQGFMGYHEWICGDGRRKSELNEMYRMGWRDALRATYKQRSYKQRLYKQIYARMGKVVVKRDDRVLDSETFAAREDRAVALVGTKT